MGYPDKETSADAGPNVTTDQAPVYGDNPVSEQKERDVEQRNTGREPDDEKNGGYLTRAEVEELLAERDRKHADELSAAKQGFPQQLVAQHAGGPGSDNHQASWSLAEQEAAARGETLDHWDV